MGAARAGVIGTKIKRADRGGRWPRWVVLLLAATSLSFSASTARASQPRPGLSLSGPLSNVLLDTEYGYTVRVVSPKSYDEAILVFSIASSSCRFQERLRLVAHRPIVRHFTAGFSPSTDPARQAIAVSVTVLPPRRGFTNLYVQRYPVTLAPGQTDTPPQAPLCSEPWFGS